MSDKNSKTKTLQLKLNKLNIQTMNSSGNLSMDEDELLSNDEPSNGDLMNILINIQKETSGTNKKLESYISSTDKRLEDVNKTIAKNNSEISSLTRKVKSCEDLTAAVNFSNELQKQKNLKNNISISGIPYIDDEKLSDIIETIFAFYNIEISKSELQTIYRVKGSRNLIIVKFVSFASKEKLMTAKMEKVIKLNDIFTSNSATSSSIDLNQIVYINNHSTPFFGKLLHQGRLLVREGKLAASWVTSNGFYVKTDENGSPIEIKNTEQLKQFSSNIDTSNNIKAQNNNNKNVNINNNSNNKKKQYKTRNNKRDAPDDENSPNTEVKQPKSKFRPGQNSQQ